jgi:RNA polymerase-associated protein
MVVRRSVMTLYSNKTCSYSHRVRFVLAEKGISSEILEVDLDDKPEDLWDLNPYGTVPTLVDRDLVLYESFIIMEYLDERFPHPPLMPVDPVSRARARLLMQRVDKDWYASVTDLESGEEERVAGARKALRDSLTVVAPVLAQKAYFLGDELTLVDCSVVPLLWRLPDYGVDLPPQAKGLKDYGERVFKRSSFVASLSSAEKEMR